MSYIYAIESLNIISNAVRRLSGLSLINPKVFSQSSTEYEGC